MEGKRVIAKRVQVLTVVTTLQNNLTSRRAICFLKTSCVSQGRRCSLRTRGDQVGSTRNLSHILLILT